jgi:hypothetical protein
MQGNADFRMAPVDYEQRSDMDLEVVSVTPFLCRDCFIFTGSIQT